jgi:hypothetical protein
MDRYLDLIEDYERNELNEQRLPASAGPDPFFVQERKKPPSCQSETEAPGLNSFSSLLSYSGIPQAWLAGVARLHPAYPPADVPSGRWRRIVDEMVRFIDSDFAASATALGWDPVDLFGCDRDRPYARIDRAGLLWLLGAGRIVALTANTATIEFPTGSRQIWRRRSSGPGRVLAWQLAGR